MHTIIVDIDGTIANAEHRLHHIKKHPKDWDAFFVGCVDDKPYHDIIDLIRQLHYTRIGLRVIYVSGRSDSVRAETEHWLRWHGLPLVDGALHMRKAGDYRPDDIIKEEILDRLGLQPSDVWFVLDDRDRVVQMWRRRGFRVLQVADGAF